MKARGPAPAREVLQRGLSEDEQLLAAWAHVSDRELNEQYLKRPRDRALIGRVKKLRKRKPDR